MGMLRKKCQFSQLQIIGIFQWKSTILSEDVIKNIYKYIDVREYLHIFFIIVNYFSNVLASKTNNHKQDKTHLHEVTLLSDISSSHGANFTATVVQAY